MGEIWSRAKFFFTGKRRSEVDEEIQFHLEREAEANMAAGMPEEEARRKAAIAFGGRERAREECREERPSWRLESVWRDVRYGIRGLGRNPGFATVAVLTLALAIGLNTTIFSLLDQALMSALPVKNPEQLVVLSFAGRRRGTRTRRVETMPGHHHEFSYPMYKDLRDQNKVLSGLIAAVPAEVGVTWNNRAESVGAELVTGNYFETLGVRPAVGRLFTASDETAAGANPVVVLSFDYWRTHLAEAPVAGKTLLVNGTPFTIAGVTAPGFHSMVWGRTPDVFVPISIQKVVEPEWPIPERPQRVLDRSAGRLRPGIDAGAGGGFAERAVSVTAQGGVYAAARPVGERADGRSSTRRISMLMRGAMGFSPPRGDMATPLTIVMGMVLLVIAMAVVNVASLLLVRAATRRRNSLSAMRWARPAQQVLRQLLAEGMLLGLWRAMLGLLLAPRALHVLIHWMSGGRRTGPTLFTRPWTGVCWAFTLAVTVVASLLFSLAPALQFRNPRVAEAM